MRFWSLLLLGTLAFALAGMNEARAAPVFQAAGAVDSGTGTASPAWPTHTTNDIALLFVESTGGEPATLSTAAGFAAVLNSPQATGTGTAGTQLTVFWARATSAAMGAPTVADPGNHVVAQIVTYRNVISTGNPWDVTAGGVKATASTSVSATGVTTTVDDTLVVVAVSQDIDSASAAFTDTSWANASLASITERVDTASNTGGGNGGGFGIADGVMASAGTTVNTTATVASTTNAFLTIALKPVPTTTLGNGTDPGSVSRDPDGASAEVDAFTLKTNGGTDLVSQIQVVFATGTAAALRLVEIINTLGSTVYGSVTEPSNGTSTITDALNIALATNISVNNVAAEYKIRVTPKSHVNMPVPPGTTYAVTAKINSWVGANLSAGSDTAGTTVTIDNTSSGIVTSATGTAGNSSVALSWTNPTDAAQVLVLRDTSSVVDPTEGVLTYGGTSTVVYVNNSPTPSATINIVDTGVTNGTSYFYKIYTRDSIGNYSVGVTPAGSPYTPAGPGCYSVATGNWDSSLTWASSAGGVPGTCPGTLLILGVPDATTPVYINFTTTSHTVTVNVANAAAASVSIGAPGTGTAGLAIGSGTLTVGASVTITGGTGTKKALLSFTTGTLKVGGSITDSGATVLTWGTGTVEYNGGGAQTVTNYGYYNLTINKASGTATTGGTIALGGSLVVTGNLTTGANMTVTGNATINSGTTTLGGNLPVGVNLTVNGGTLNLGANSADGGGTGTLSLASGATMKIAQGNYFPSGYTVSLNPNSTVEFNATFNQTIPAPGVGANYGNLLFSNSGNRNMSAMTIAGNLTTTDTTAAIALGSLTIRGNISIGASTTFTSGAYTVTMDGTSAQSIGGGVTSISFNNLTINNSAGVTANVNLSIGGNFTNTAGFNAGTTTTTFNGTAAQTLDATGATTTFYNLVFNNSAGFVLNKDMTASNALTLTSGVVATGSNALISSSCSVTRTSGYVNGNLRKSFTGAQLACDFEIGDSTNYTPVNVSFSSVSANGTVTAKSTSGDHSQVTLGSSSIDSTKSVNRYWTLTPGGGLGFGGVTLTFTYIGGSPVDNDDNTSSITDSYIVQRYQDASGCLSTGGGWNNTTLIGTPTATTATATGPTTFGSYCSHFAIGKGGGTGATSVTREREFIFNRERYY